MNKYLSLLVVGLFFGHGAQASFAENSRRYFSTKDMFSVLTQKFPVLNNPDRLQHVPMGKTEKIAPTCWAIGVRNESATGLTIPAIGAPAATAPGAAFVRWWSSCVDEIVRQQFEELKAKPSQQPLFAKYWAPELLLAFRDPNDTKNPYHRLQEETWDNLKPGQRFTQIRFLIEELIGPNAVITDLGFAKGIGDLTQTIQRVVPDDSPLKLSEANRKLITAIALREEFLTY